MVCETVAMASGIDLLKDMRRSASGWSVFACGARPDAGTVVRSGLVATLLSEVVPADAPLVRALTREEIAAVREAGDGCGDTLLACCWLLFMLGDVEDALLIWKAKNLNFDTHCYIDSVLLISQGPDATAAFAQAQGLDDLASWVRDGWIEDPSEAAESWRSRSFFEEAPPASESLETLAAWLQS